eukprot:3881888-Pyramimonas_sp.AAC.1
MVSSSKHISAALSAELGDLVGDPACARMTNLGVEFTAGRAVRAPGRNRYSKAKQRAAAALRKAR